jgi:hypothetical protein
VGGIVDKLDDDLGGLARAILRKLGFVERQMEVVSHLLSFIRGEYGEAESWSGTVYADVEMHKSGVLAFPFKLFAQEQRDCLLNWCPAGVLEIEFSNSNVVTCCLNAIIPSNPLILISENIDVEIVFDLHGHSDGLLVSKRTNTNAGAKQIQMALLAHLLA